MLIDSTGRATDSLKLHMKKYSYQVVINGVKDGKMQYELKKKRAVYEYALVEEDDNPGRNRLYRWIFILSSLAGFILLVGLFLRRRKIVNA